MNPNERADPLAWNEHKETAPVPSEHSPRKEQVVTHDQRVIVYESENPSASIKSDCVIEVKQ